MPSRRVLAIACLLLAGCDKTANQPAGKAAAAQVLPGTISDAMLDVDQSRARPLLQPPPRPVSGPSSSASDTPGDDASPGDPAKPAPAN